MYWWQGPEKKSLLYTFESLGSTQDFAKYFIEASSPSSWIWVRALRQTQGRGQHHRKWISPLGGLYQTLVCAWPHATSSWISLAAALAVTDTLSSLPCVIKWPNDVFIGGKKLAGILVERVPGTSAHGWCLIGIGLNVLAQEEDLKASSQPSTSLRMEGFLPLDLEKVRASLEDHLFDRLKDLIVHGRNLIIKDAQKRLAYIGQEVYFKTPHGYFQGIFQGLTPEGLLLLNGRPYHALRVGKTLEAVT